MRVKDLMTTDVCCVRPETSIPEIASQMRRSDIGTVPVCNDKGEILGIITDRDIVLRFLTKTQSAGDESNKDIHASEIMSQDVVTTTEDTDIHDAALLLSKNKIRRLPVVSGNRLVGILTTCDIARCQILADEAGDILTAISNN